MTPQQVANLKAWDTIIFKGYEYLFERIDSAWDISITPIGKGPRSWLWKSDYSGIEPKDLTTKIKTMKVRDYELELRKDDYNKGVCQLRHADLGIYMFTSSDAEAFVKKNETLIAEYFDEKVDAEIENYVNRVNESIRDLNRYVERRALKKESRMRIGSAFMKGLEPQLKVLCNGLPAVNQLLNYFNNIKK